MTLLQGLLVAIGQLAGLVFIVWGIIGKIYEKQIDALKQHLNMMRGEVEKVHYMEKYLWLKYEERLKIQEEKLKKQKEIAIEKMDDEKKKDMEALIKENKELREKLKDIQDTKEKYAEALDTASAQSYTSGSIDIHTEEVSIELCPNCHALAGDRWISDGKLLTPEHFKCEKCGCEWIHSLDGHYKILHQPKDDRGNRKNKGT
ncbi:MAG: hypothetical protein WBD28_00150 [Candidatus Zixiibacteriota bacterium]